MDSQLAADSMVSAPPVRSSRKLQHRLSFLYSYQYRIEEYWRQNRPLSWYHSVAPTVREDRRLAVLHCYVHATIGCATSMRRLAALRPCDKELELDSCNDSNYLVRLVIDS